MIYLVLLLNRNKLNKNKNSVSKLWCNIRITIWMLHTKKKKKRLEIYIDINIDISYADYYTWIFTSKIFRLALEIASLVNKYFFLPIAYESLSKSRKLNKEPSLGSFWFFFQKRITWLIAATIHATFTKPAGTCLFLALRKRLSDGKCIWKMLSLC